MKTSIMTIIICLKYKEKGHNARTYRQLDKYKLTKSPLFCYYLGEFCHIILEEKALSVFAFDNLLISSKLLNQLNAYFDLVLHS